MADIKHKRCSNCLGRGHFEGMGHMGKRKCMPCNGIGYIALNADVAIEAVPQKPPKRAYNKRKAIEADKDLVADNDDSEELLEG